MPSAASEASHRAPANPPLPPRRLALLQRIAPNWDGQSSLHDFMEGERGMLVLATMNGLVGTVRFLLEAGLNPNGTGGADAPLAYVFRRGTSLVPLLLQAGADIELQDDDGLTPILNAVNVGCLSAFEALLKAGANIHQQGSQRLDYVHHQPTPLTALTIAASEHPSLIPRLLDLGVDPEPLVAWLDAPENEPFQSEAQAEWTRWSLAQTLKPTVSRSPKGRL